MGALTPEVSKKEVLAYATPLIHKFINQYAANVPYEQKEELAQSAYLRVLEAYENIQVDKGWKSYVYNHCRGAVLDYLKFGHGFEEFRWSLMKEEEHGSRNVAKVNTRLVYDNSEGTEMDIDTILGLEGVFTEANVDEFQIDWEMASRMSRHDNELHAFCLYLRGNSIEVIGPVLGISRARVGQIIEAFVDRVRNIGHWSLQWDLQIARLFGIDKRKGLGHIEFVLGNELEPVDFEDLSKVYTEDAKQVKLF